MVARTALLFALLLTAGCGGNLKVVKTPEGEKLARTAKPPTCGIPLLRTVQPADRFVVLARDGLLVTAEHVVHEAVRVSVQFEGKPALAARIVRQSARDDLAILQIDAPTPDFLRLAAASTIQSGDRIFTFGFPAVQLLGGEPKYSDGALSASSGPRGEKAWFQMTVPVQPGNSGGPVVTESGLAVGIVTATASVERFYEATGSLPQNVNWATKSDLALELLGRPAESPLALDRDAAVHLARRAVCAVTAPH